MTGDRVTPQTGSLNQRVLAAIVEGCKCGIPAPHRGQANHVMSVLREGPIREAATAIGLEEVWACSVCGLHPNNGPNWCARGCGRDYNRMEPLWRAAG